VQETFRLTLIWLAGRGVVDQQRQGGPRDTECRERARQHGFYPINDKALEDMLSRTPDAGEVHCQGTWIFLPAPKKGSLRLPILNVIYDYDKKPAEIRLQAAIFYDFDGEALAMGWRFESPESRGEGGEQSSHGYYHAQPSPSLRTHRGWYELPAADRRIPDGLPAFPLDAADEVDLLLCLMLSIYGLKEASELVGAVADPELAKRLRQLRTLYVPNNG
jgi:hypothetical protein